MAQYDPLKPKLKNLRCAIDIEFYPLAHTDTQKKYLLVYPTEMDFNELLRLLKTFRVPRRDLYFLNQEMFEDMNIIDQLEGKHNENH
ncbi:MAG: hypothetical protein ACRCSC_01810 [Lactococcus garvieae]